MNADKLADALREKIAKWRGMKKGELYLAAQICADELERLLAEYDAQPAQTMTPRELAKRIERGEEWQPAQAAQTVGVPEVFALLEIFQSWIGPRRPDKNDDNRDLWDRVAAVLAAAPQPPAQPCVIAPSAQTLPLKSAPYEMTTTAQPSAIQQDNERAADSACLVLIGMGYAWTGKEWTQAKAQPSADACDHEWLTDNFGPTRCRKCGNSSTDAVRAAEENGNG